MGDAIAMGNLPAGTTVAIAAASQGQILSESAAFTMQAQDAVILLDFGALVFDATASSDLTLLSVSAYWTTAVSVYPIPLFSSLGTHLPVGGAGSAGIGIYTSPRPALRLRDMGLGAPPQAIQLAVVVGLINSDVVNPHSATLGWRAVARVVSGVAT